MLMYERQHPWKLVSFELAKVVLINSLCAAVQGMGMPSRPQYSTGTKTNKITDQTVVNGAQLFYAPQFGIQDSPWILGLVNSAPYLACLAGTAFPSLASHPTM